MTPKDALQEAVSRAGSQTAFAAAIGPKIRTGHVYHWLKTGQLPVEHCPVVESVYGVRCEDLRPDVRWDLLRSRPVAETATTAAA